MDKNKNVYNIKKEMRHNMIDFTNSILWNKKKLNKTYNYIKDNCTLKQVTTQYLTFIYCKKK